MPTYAQLPGSLSLALRTGDEFGTQVDFTPTDLTGYTVTSQIVSLVSGLTVTSIATTLADAAAGKVNLAMTETQTAAMVPGTYGWRLEWNAPGDVKRTALSGMVEVTR